MNRLARKEESSKPWEKMGVRTPTKKKKKEKVKGPGGEKKRIQECGSGHLQWTGIKNLFLVGGESH